MKTKNEAYKKTIKKEPTEQHSIGKDQAIALAKTQWWKNLTAREIVQVQLFTQELCMDFNDFCGALEEALDRPVFNHELALNYEGIVEEFLGKRKAPTMNDIIELIPADKRVVVTAP
jgi:hypothetical protein